MKAYVLHGVNDLRYEDVPVPVPRAGNVLVNVMAAGICGSDIPRIYGTGAYFYPLIPGHEFAGVVTETGSDADREWLGRCVGVFPLIPCGKCAQCQSHQYKCVKTTVISVRVAMEGLRNMWKSRHGI